MALRTFLAAAASIAALSSPALVHAQAYGDVTQARQYAALEGFRGYPEFRADKMRIREQIRMGLGDGSISAEQARVFRAQLAQIQDDEALQFRDHGWSLTPGDRQELRASLDDLAGAVDDVRDSGA